MSSFLMFCTKCGVYMKGALLLSAELDKHKCDSNPQQMNESITECKAILDTLTKKGFSLDDKISNKAAAHQSAPPPPPPPLPIANNAAEKKAMQVASENFAKVQIELKEKLLKRRRDHDDGREDNEKRCRKH